MKLLNSLEFFVDDAGQQHHYLLEMLQFCTKKEEYSINHGRDLNDTQKKVLLWNL